MENKTYLLEEAKELVKNGTHQVHNDCSKDSIEKHNILYEVCSKMGQWEYYTFDDCDSKPFNNLEIIPLSAIEDIRWGDEVQGSDDNVSFGRVVILIGVNPYNNEYVTALTTNIAHWKYIRKPVPNFSALIQSTQEAVDKIAKGYVVKIEKL